MISPFLFGLASDEGNPLGAEVGPLTPRARMSALAHNSPEGVIPLSARNARPLRGRGGRAVRLGAPDAYGAKTVDRART